MDPLGELTAKSVDEATGDDFSEQPIKKSPIKAKRTERHFRVFIAGSPILFLNYK